jgi:hypothetical protein
MASELTGRLSVIYVLTEQSTLEQIAEYGSKAFYEGEIGMLPFSLHRQS